MSEITQSINLYARLEPAKAKPMSLVYMALAWLAVFVGYGATAGFLAHQESSLKRAVADANALNRQLQQQISQRQTQDQQVDLGPIESRLTDLRQKQQRQQLLIEFLQEADLSAQTSFSEAMAGLARQHVPGIAIERFALQAMNNKISIEGQLAKPEALPMFVKRLGAEPAFEDLQLNKVVMTITDEQLSFEMSSAVPRERDS